MMQEKLVLGAWTVMQNSILPLMMQEKLVLMGRRELVALLTLSSWCLVMVEGLFLAVPRGCLRFVIVVFPDHTHYFLGAWTVMQNSVLRS